MTREELVRLLVLMRICDDYEEHELLHDEMVRDYPELSVEPADVSRALRQLIELRLAHAYELGEEGRGLLVGVPSEEEFAECYFMANKEGIRVQAECGIPFNDDGNLDQQWWARHQTP